MLHNHNINITDLKETTEQNNIEMKKIKNVLKQYYNMDKNIVEIGVDEVGRGPLFGRVYTAAVILPKDDTFDCSKLKDSKLFH